MAVPTMAVLSKISFNLEPSENSQFGQKGKMLHYFSTPAKWK